MSDGGFDVDEHLKKQQNYETLFDFRIDSETGYRVKHQSILKTGSSIKNQINNLREASVHSSIQKRRSFSELLNEGWTKEKLMKHFVLSEYEFERVVESLAKIQNKLL